MTYVHYTIPALSAEKAPSGYGYGGAVVALGTFDTQTELETALATLVSGMAAREAKQISFGCTELSGSTFRGAVHKLSATYSFVEASVWEGHSIHLMYNNGTWTLKWANPPMVVGVEYRTTEYSGGSVVFCQRISLPNLASEATYAASLMSSVSQIIRHTGNIGRVAMVPRTNGAAAPTGAYAIDYYISGSGIIVRCGSSLVGGTAYMTLGYTKS